MSKELEGKSSPREKARGIMARSRSHSSLSSMTGFTPSRRSSSLQIADLSSRIRTISLQEVVLGASREGPVAGPSGLPMRQRSTSALQEFRDEMKEDSNAKSPRGRQSGIPDEGSQTIPGGLTPSELKELQVSQFKESELKRNRSFTKLSAKRSKHERIVDDDNLLICGNVLKFTVCVECEEGMEMEEVRRIFHYEMPDQQEAEGGFGKVYIAKKIPGDEKFAVKVYGIKSGKRLQHLKQEEGQEALIESLHEIMVLLAVKGHPNFVTIVEHFMINHLIHIVMEVEEDSMYNQIAFAYRAGMPEAKARRWFCQVVEAIGYMHQLGIVHGDIKPDNVMISRLKNNTTICKLTDFGLSRFLQEASERIKGGHRVGKDVTRRGKSNPKVLTPGLRRLKAVLTTPLGFKATPRDQKGTPYPLVDATHMVNDVSSFDLRAQDVLDLGDTLLAMLNVESKIFRTKQGVMDWTPIRIIQRHQIMVPQPVNLSIEAKHLIGSLLWSEDKERITTKELLHPSWQRREETKWLLLPSQEPGFHDMKN